MIRFYEFRSGRVISVLLDHAVRIIAVIVLFVGIVWFELKFARKSRKYDTIITATKETSLSCSERCYSGLIWCLIIFAILLSIIVFALEMTDQVGHIRLRYYQEDDNGPNSRDYTINNMCIARPLDSNFTETYIALALRGNISWCLSSLDDSSCAIPLCSSSMFKCFANTTVSLCLPSDTNRYQRYAYTVLSFVLNLVYAIITILMVVATAYIGAAWQSAENSIQTSRPNKLYDIYENTGKFVSVVQGAFQPWFVLQWIAYFVGIVQQSQSIKTFIDDGFIINDTTREFENNYLYCIMLAGINLFLTISFFVIPYGCGILMIKYHDKYIKHLKDKLRQLTQDPQQNEQNDIEKKQKILLFIIQHAEYRFTPRIASLHIPLDFVGHQLTILITILGLLLS